MSGAQQKLEGAELRSFLRQHNIARLYSSPADLEEESRSPNSIITAQFYHGLISLIRSLGANILGLLFLHILLFRIVKEHSENIKQNFFDYKSQEVPMPATFFNSHHNGFMYPEVLSKIIKELDKRLTAYEYTKNEIIQLQDNFAKEMTNLFTSIENNILEKIKFAAIQNPELLKFYEEAVSMKDTNKERQELLPKVLAEEPEFKNLDPQVRKNQGLVIREIQTNQFIKDAVHVGALTNEEAEQYKTVIKNTAKSYNDSLKAKKSQASNEWKEVLDNLKELYSVNSKNSHTISKEKMEQLQQYLADRAQMIIEKPEFNSNEITVASLDKWMEVVENIDQCTTIGEIMSKFEDVTREIVLLLKNENPLNASKSLQLLIIEELKNIANYVQPDQSSDLNLAK